MIRSGNEASSESMIDEANRIISENTDGGRGGFLYSKRWHILAFWLGAVTTFSVLFVLWLTGALS